jgi:hypothetical protein
VALLIAIGAAAVALTGTADDLRDAWRLSFAGVERTPGEALGIALHNAKLAAATLMCALAAPRLPLRARLLADIALATVLAVNASIVGLALGAYGERLAAATAGHLPIEFAALSVAGGAYLSARRGPVNARALACIGALCGMLLLVAAAAETYASGRST